MLIYVFICYGHWKYPRKVPLKVYRVRVINLSLLPAHSNRHRERIGSLKVFSLCSADTADVVAGWHYLTVATV